jgi:hypothetical protein
VHAFNAVELLKMDLSLLVSKQTGSKITQSTTCLMKVDPLYSNGQNTALGQCGSIRTAIIPLWANTLLMQYAATFTSVQQ